MTLRRLTGFTALLLIAVGIALAGWGPVIAPWFGVPASPVPDPATVESIGWWKLASFVRLFGMGLLAFGALLWIVRGSLDSIGVRRFAVTMSVIGVLTALVALVQQVAIWETAAGLALVALFAALGLGYGWTALRVDRARV